MYAFRGGFIFYLIWLTDEIYCIEVGTRHVSPFNDWIACDLSLPKYVL
jgi:hypothetical protein